MVEIEVTMTPYAALLIFGPLLVFAAVLTVLIVVDHIRGEF